MCLSWTIPSTENARLFVEWEDLDTLEAIYRKSLIETVPLPDPPILRRLGTRVDGMPILEILAGERRITAAKRASIGILHCRIVDLNDEDAYLFITAHNDVKSLTTVEKAYRVAEMIRLGFGVRKIQDTLHVGANRFQLVGGFVNPALFTDTKKLCDPNITLWHDAATIGEEHFLRCFAMWDLGLWDDTTCQKEFRKSPSLPSDNATKGFRATYDLDRFILRGQLDLSLMDKHTALSMLETILDTVREAGNRLVDDDHFGPREVRLINPDTL